MSRLETIRAAIVATMQSVPDIGLVHDYQRYAKTADDLAALYVSTIDGTDQLRGWYVTRVARRNARKGFGGPLATNTWKIRGYMALEDEAATELQFDALLEALMAAFWVDQNLGGAVITTATPDQDAALNLDEAAPVMFAGVLCHGAWLTLRTEHTET